MKRSTQLTTFAAACLAVSAALVSTSTRAAMDCGSTLDKASTAISGMSTANAERRAALRRMAMTGYDHCMAGDVSAAEKFFAMVMAGGNQR